MVRLKFAVVFIFIFLGILVSPSFNLKNDLRGTRAIVRIEFRTNAYVIAFTLSTVVRVSRRKRIGRYGSDRICHNRRSGRYESDRIGQVFGAGFGESHKVFTIFILRTLQKVTKIVRRLTFP